MTPIRLLRRALPTRLLLVLAGLALVTVAHAQVTLNLKDADISTLIATVSEVTGKNFIVDPRVKGKVTVVSSSPMDADGVYETFLAVLQVQGFAAIPSGDTIKIVPETGARTDGGAFSDGQRPTGDELVTKVYNIQNVSAVQLVPILRPLVPQWGHLAAYPPSNMLIISDRASNVIRLESLIRQIDQTSDREIDMVQLRHASASEVVRTVQSLAQQGQQGGEGASSPAVIIADERSNAVLIGGDKSERQKILDIVMRLDVPVGEDGATQVIYLEYGDAENLAGILAGYAEKIGDGENRPGGQAQTATAGASAAGAMASVVADKDTNALIVTAPPKAMRQIRDVIAKLDVRRSQVLVEGLIAELSADRSSQLGIDWAVYNGERVAAAGILNPNTLSALGSVATADSSDRLTSAAGVLEQGVNIAGGRWSSGGTSFALLLKALAGDGDTNVLSTPTLTTMDNEEAEFTVGQEVPFLTGSFSNTGSSSNGSVNPFQTINREDVGLTLGITPQINEGNTVKLKMKLEISSLAAGSSGAVDLVTNKRTLTNTVSVDSGQILVLGGLLDDSLNESQQRVPVLSAIPILGNLFKYRSVNRTKRNLMVFMRPSILRDAAAGNYYTRQKYEALRADQTDNNRRIPLIGGQRPVLRSFDEYQADTLATPIPSGTQAPSQAQESLDSAAPAPIDEQFAPPPQ